MLPFKIANPNFPDEVIKIKHLATHTSSLIDNDTTRFKLYSLGTKPIMGLDSFIKDYYVPNGKFYSLQNFGKNKAGLEYAYSNIATTLMAYIIEVKSKMSFNDFTNKYIFQPLKMSHTSWYYDEKYKSQYATLYQIVKPENPLYYKLMNADNSLKTYCTVTYPDGSLYTSIKDLSNYMKIMMKGYFSDQTEIINKTSYETLFRKRFSEKDMPLNMDTKEPNRGIFWSYSKKGAIRHTGSSAGVFAFLSINPITKVGRIMMLNGGLDGEDNVQTVGYFLKVIAALDSFEETLK